MKIYSDEEIFFKCVEELKLNLSYDMYDIHYYDSYFALDRDDKCMCDFKIKQIPDFLFGIWSTKLFEPIQSQIAKGSVLWCDNLRVPAESNFVLFAQYIPYIDKFKPSTSGLICGLHYYINKTGRGRSTKSEIVWHDMDEWVSFIKFIKQHRQKSIYYSGYSSKPEIYEQQSMFTILKDNIISIHNIRKYIRRKIRHRKMVLTAVIRMLKIGRILNFFIVDIPNMSPCYTVHLLDEGLTESQLQVIDLIIKQYFMDVEIHISNTISEYKENYMNSKKFIEDGTSKICYIRPGGILQ